MTGNQRAARGRTLWLAALASGLMSMAPVLEAAEPEFGDLSEDSPSVTWNGTFLISNPGPFVGLPSCLSVQGIDPICDRFLLSIVGPQQDFVVRVRVTTPSAEDPSLGSDDIDLFVQDPEGETVAVSGSAGAVEEVLLFNPPPGTYTVVVAPFLVVPGVTYTGTAHIGEAAKDEFSKAYHGAIFTEDLVGEPESRPASRAGLVPQLKVSFNDVGRQAGEPTIGVNANNVAFFAAAAFDVPTPDAPARLASTRVMRSRDKGETWEIASPVFRLSEDVEVGDPPFTLDPMIHVDPEAGETDPVTGSKKGRVFSVDLDLACGANTVFSDNEGETWTTIPAFGCAQPVNDHHTIITANPTAGLTTVGYPNLLYFCFNRVSDSSCNRSLDGGLTFTASGLPAFTGSDPPAFCGGLHGHLAADSLGNIFLPKGHCGLPWVARSADAGATWERFRIAGHTPMADHEVSLAVDTQDNIYAVWQGSFRLPFLSTSRDGGRTWSTPLMIAPPGVHEANFPAIVAGDPGRIAILFPGSKSRDFDDLTRPWDLYVVMSVNALDPDPKFLFTLANPANDPVHRSTCGPGRCEAFDEEGNGRGNMLDFLDIQYSPADGAFWGTASDTCTGDCVKNPQPSNLDPGQGFAVRQVKGPPLFVNGPPP